MNKLFTARLGQAGSFYVMLEAFDDVDSNPNDELGMSVEDIRAFEYGYWRYALLKVVIRYYGTELGRSSYVGYVPYGEGDDWKRTEEDICCEVLSEHSWMIDEAITEAKRQWEIICKGDFDDFVESVAIGRYSDGGLVK
jgi:hypothetical protein